MKGIRKAGGALALGLAAWSAATPAATLITGVDDTGGSRVRVFDYIDPLTPVADFLAFDPAFRGGVRVAVGDIDADGTADRIVAAGAGGGPRVVVFSGADNSVLADFLAFDANFSGGLTVAAGDVNGDGRADIVVGTGNGSSRVRVFDARNTAQPLLDFFAFNAQYTGGIDVAAGDFNANGRADILAAPSGPFAPVVDIFDGQTGIAMNRVFPFDQQYQGGINVAVGDLDGNGSDELIAAAAGNAGPRVVAINIVNQQRVVDFLAFDPAFTGGVRIAAGDLDGDGRDDLVAGAGAGGSGRVRVFSGANVTTVLADFFAYGNNYTGGVFVDASSLPAAAAMTGQLQFASAGFRQGEVGPQAIITVRRVNGSSGAASVAFAATAGTAGSADFMPVSGTLNWQDGDAADKTFQVPIVDDALDEADETVLLNLSNAVGAPLGQPATATLTILDDDLPAVPSELAFDASSYQVNEAAGTLTVTVRRIGDPSGGASVSFAATAGTAGSADFTPVGGTLTWPDGDAADKTFQVPITDDRLDESDETVTLSLSNAVGASLGQPATATLTILDDDPPAVPPRLAFDAASYQVGEAAGALTVTVRRLGDTSAAASARVRTASGTAVAGDDFTAVDTTLNWPAGDATPRTVSIAIADDILFEPNEAFTVQLQVLSGGTLSGPVTVTVTLVSDEALASAVFSQAEYRTAENGAVTLTVLRSGEIRTRVQLTYRTFSGSADAAEPTLDYTATGGTLVFDPGVTERTITVAILTDTIIEADERFSVLIENPSDGLSIPQTRGRVLILDDDTPPPEDGELFFGGSMNPLLLGPLLLLGLLRRRRRPGLLAIAGLIASPVCLAAPWYVGVRGGSGA